jgi:ribosome-binding factor A|tara:strand:- start:2467 stop:2847 length:381 start_codon:yes stop_codon:yes gene_type:complete
MHESRKLKVGEEIRHAISKIFERGVLRDPNLQDITLTVTEVKMSNDLKSAVAFVVPMGSSNQDQIIKGLNHASFFVRKKITEFITLKFLPKIIFRIDNSFDKFRKVDSILKRPEVMQDIQMNSKKN